jgi:hypothetical protein
VPAANRFQHHLWKWQLATRNRLLDDPPLPDHRFHSIRQIIVPRPQVEQTRGAGHLAGEAEGLQFPFIVVEGLSTNRPVWAGRFEWCPIPSEDPH